MNFFITPGHAPWLLRYALVLLLGTGAPTLATAQPEVLDSLRALLPATTAPPARGQLLLRLAKATPGAETDAALAYVAQALRLAAENKLPDIATKALRQRGDLLHHSGAYDDAMAAYEAALAEARSLGDSSLISGILNGMGLVDQMRGNFPASDGYLHAALRIDRARRDTNGMAAILTNLARSANRRGDTDLTIAYLDTVLVLDSLQASWGYFSQGLGNIALTYLRLDRTDEALGYAFRGLDAAGRAGNPAGQYLAAATISEIYTKLRDFGPALDYGHRALGYARTFGRKQEIGQAHLLLQVVHQARKDRDSVTYYFEAAENYIGPAKRPTHYNNYGTFFRNALQDTAAAKYWYQRSLTAATELDNGPLTFMPLTNLAMVAAAEQDWLAARTYLRRAAAFPDMEIDLEAPTLTTMGRIYLASDEPRRAADYFQRALALQEDRLVTHDSTRSLATSYERELAELRATRQAENLATTTAQVTARNRSLLAIGLLALLLAGAVWLAVRWARRAERANAQLETLREEIHHRVRNDFQSVASMFFVHLNELEDDTLRATLNGVYDRVRGLGQVHELLQENQGKPTGLADYLRTLATKRLAALPAGARVRLDYRFDLTAKAANRFTELQVRQLGILLNELITNAGKHAFAGHPDPVLRLSAAGAPGQAITFAVEDNGATERGTTAAAAPASTSFGSRMIDTICGALGWAVVTQQTDRGHRVLIQTNLIA